MKIVYWLTLLTSNIHHNTTSNIQHNITYNIFLVNLVNKELAVHKRNNIIQKVNYRCGKPAVKMEYKLSRTLGWVKLLCIIHWHLKSSQLKLPSPLLVIFELMPGQYSVKYKMSVQQRNSPLFNILNARSSFLVNSIHFEYHFLPRTLFILFLNTSFNKGANTNFKYPNHLHSA